MKVPRHSLIPIGFFLLLLTLEPLRQFWAAWLAFVPLFLFIQSGPRFGRDASLGYGVGLIYCGLALYWIALYELRIFFLVVPLVALPWIPLFGAVTLTASLVKGKNFIRVLLGILIPPLVWVSFFPLLALTAFGTLPLELPFYPPLLLLQLAAFGGLGPLVFLILTFNTAMAVLIQRKDRATLLTTFLLLFILLAAAGWGWVRISKPSPGTIPVALVQTNFPISTEWRKKNTDLILKKYESLAMEAAESKPALIFFPQYGLPFDAYREPEFFTKLAQKTNALIFLGTYIPREPGGSLEKGARSNVALVFSPTGLIGTYQATLGPPFRRTGQMFGSEYPEIDTPAGRVGILLCYEDAVPSVAKKWKARGVDFFAALSNTGHFIGTSVPRYHLIQDQLRAIEMARPMIRVTPNGHSAVIDSKGRLRIRSGRDREEILISRVEASSPRPP